MTKSKTKRKTKRKTEGDYVSFQLAPGVLKGLRKIYGPVMPKSTLVNYALSRHLINLAC